MAGFLDALQGAGTPPGIVGGGNPSSLTALQALQAAKAHGPITGGPFAHAGSTGTVAPIVPHAPNGGGPQDFLSWLGDILDRPRNALANIANQGFSDIQQNTVDAQAGKPIDYLGEIGGLLSAPARGFFSTNPADKATTSQLIEKGTDAIGGATDPNYVNVPDNVTPALKGALGFVGDVALDPLTYLPGPDLATLAGKLGLGGSAASKSLAEALKTGTELPAEEHAAQAGAGALSGGIPAPATVGLNADSAKAVSSALQPSSILGPGAVTHPTALLPSALVRASDKFGDARSLLGELKSGPDVASAIAGPALKRPPMSVDDWVSAVQRKDPARFMAYAGKNELTARELPGFFADPKVPDAVKAHVQDQIQVGHDAYVERHAANPENQLPKQQVQPAKAMSMMERFANMRSTPDGAERIDRALGSGISRSLSMTRSEAGFAKKVDDVNQVLDRTDMLDNITDPAQMTPGGQAIVAHLTRSGRNSLDVPWMNQQRISGNLTKPSEAGTVQQLSDAATAGDAASAQALEAMKVPQLTPVEQAVVDRYPSAMKDEIYARSPQGTGWKGFLNQDAQAAINKTIRDDAIRAIGERAKTGEFQTSKAPEAYNRARALRDEVLPQMETTDQLHAKLGVPTYIGVDHDLTPMSMSQIVSHLNTTDENATLMALFNRSTMIPDTNLADAVNLALKGGDENSLVEALLNNAKRTGGTFPNQLVDNKGKLYFGHFRPVGSQGALREPRFPFHVGPEDTRPTPISNGGKGFYAKYTPDQVARTVARAILNTKDDLAKTVTDNGIDYAHRLSMETGDLATAERNKLTAILNSPDVSGSLSAIAHIDRDVASLGTSAHATQDAVNLASTIAEGTVEPDLKISADAAQKLSNLNLSQTADWMDHAHFQAVGKAAREADAAFARNAEEIYKLQQADLASKGMIDPEPEIPLFDISDKAYRDIASNVNRRMDSLGAAFSIRHDNPHVWDALSGWLEASSERVQKFGNNLSDLAKHNPGVVGDTTVVDQAFHNWQHGILKSTSEIDKAAAEIETIFGQNWHGQAALLSNHFFGKEMSIDAINEELRHSGLNPHELTGEDDFFDAGKAIDLAAEKHIPVAQAAMEQIKEWDVKDSMDFMHRMYIAGERVNTDAALMSHFVRTFARQGVLTTDKAIAKAKGFVELTSQGRSKYFKYLPPGTYVHSGLASELHFFDEFAQMSRTLSGPFGKWMARNVDPMLRAWKRSVTILHPGHHVRNLVGDLSLTFISQGPRKFAASSRDALKLMSMSKGYNNVELSSMLNELGVREMPKGHDVMLHLKDGPVTVQEAYEQAFRGGLFPTFRHVEGLYNAEQKGGFQHFVDAATGGTGMTGRVLGGVSEARDHWGRGQHFMQILHQAEKKLPAGVTTRQQLFDYATQRVRKFHPDGSNLSPFERKYLTRAVPFYTWFRGALPVVIESMFTHPGRVQVFAKAGYNMAVASGLNPDSISNPFPVGGVYPKFLTDQMAGPQFQVNGQEVGISPGIASWDIMNTIANPLQGAIGMLNPMVRIPAEVATGAHMGTQSPITNWPDYWNQQIPNAAYIANITGKSPAGVVAAMLGQQQPGKPDITVPKAFQQGNKTGFDQGLALINYLTGASATNYSRPDYLKFANKQQAGIPVNAKIG